MNAETEGQGLKQLGSANTQYKYNKPSVEILETFENKHPDQIHLVTLSQARDEFSSLCPVTNQPDQAKIEVIYIPNERMVESKSFKLYLFAFRNHGSFHEDIVNTILKDLWQVLSPKYLRIFGDFSPRGGIAIKPIVEKWGKLDLGLPLFQQIIRLVNSWDRKR
jgi:7-cyano-7-deazaguanine reductase